MDKADIVIKYFPELDDRQVNQIKKLGQIIEEWNSKVNIVSRKDIDHLFERHILHSLGIAKVIRFKKDTRILDVGTGGGFPGLPLAILHPESRFHLIDSIGKKIRVVQNAIERLGLNHVTCEQIRAEDIKGQFDFIISRAVTQLPKFINWTINKISTRNFNDLNNGILYLKGGDFTEELKNLHRPVESFELKEYFNENFFLTKKVIYLKTNPQD